MDTKHREVFHNILLGLQLLYHESFGTELEYDVMHVILEVQRLSEPFGANEHEYMGILLNVSRVIEDKPLIDVDRYIEDMKLCDLLRDIDF
jgi:hypothetical protein